MIDFNRPHITGKETDYIIEAVKSGKLSGNGIFTKKCQAFFEDRFEFGKCLLTSSCTDALEMAAILCNIQPGDEVIIPSYTFVSTANAFVLRGAKIVFADSREDHPGINEDEIEGLITPKTKVIVPVHYAGVACDMDKIMSLAKKYDLLVVEDAAQAVDSYYTNSDGNKKALGSIGDFAAFSFHETKNIISGEGGMLVVNNTGFIKRAEIIWEKGTNRSAFFRGEIDKYSWVDIGSSFLPSEITAAFLWAQIENLDDIQSKRKEIWENYNNLIQINNLGLKVKTPEIPKYATNNAHMFYCTCHDLDSRNQLLSTLKKKGILSVFHYLSLHRSSFFLAQHDRRILVNSDRYAETLLRLPFYYELSFDEQEFVINQLTSFFKTN